MARVSSAAKMACPTSTPCIPSSDQSCSFTSQCYISVVKTRKDTVPGIPVGAGGTLHAAHPLAVVDEQVELAPLLGGRDDQLATESRSSMHLWAPHSLPRSAQRAPKLRLKWGAHTLRNATTGAAKAPARGGENLSAGGPVVNIKVAVVTLLLGLGAI